MNCHKSRRLIGDLLDGTIKPGDRAKLEAHLQSCPDCRSLAEDFQKIASEAKTLSEDEPSDKVWPAVLKGVRDARRAERLDRARPAALASPFARPALKWAGAAVVLVAGIAIGIVLGRRPWTGATVAENGAKARLGTVAKLEEAEKHYLLAIQAMTDAVHPASGDLNPQMAAMFESDLRIVDSAIQQCRTAVTRQPEDLDARVFLLGALQKKMDVLNGIMDLKKNLAAEPKAGAAL